MRQEAITTSLLCRLGVRSHWLVVLLLGGTFCLLRAVTGPPDRAFSAAGLLFPFLLLTAHLALAPLPWQWTGDDRDRAEAARGLLQALVFNALWLGVVCAALHFSTHAPAPRPLPPPRPFPPMGPRPHLFPGPHPFQPEVTLWMVNVAFATAFGWLFAEREATAAREREMAALLRQSQSRALQSQLEPHVLINALSSLSELIHDDPLAAEEMVTGLADLYRILMVHGEAASVPLGQERRLVETYLAMEQMRLGDRLRTAWDWPSWADTLELPPLFLQPLVENAIKHGISPAASGGEVRISLNRVGKTLSLRVANTGRPFRPGSAEGIGIRNLKARLALWTEVTGTFRLEAEAGWTVAEVQWTPEGMA